MSEHGTFMRVATAVGDLASPFYQEERQRDVWNEASAVGFQAMLWLGTVAATVMIWVGRAAAVPYALGLLAIVGAASWVTVAYAHRSGIDVEDPSRMWRPATALFLGLLGVFSVGMFVAVDWGVGGGFSGGLGVGAAVGSAAGVVVVGGRMVWRRLRPSARS